MGRQKIYLITETDSAVFNNIWQLFSWIWGWVCQLLPTKRNENKTISLDTYKMWKWSHLLTGLFWVIQEMGHWECWMQQSAHSLRWWSTMHMVMIHVVYFHLSLACHLLYLSLLLLFSPFGWTLYSIILSVSS